MNRVTAARPLYRFKLNLKNVIAFITRKRNLFSYDQQCGKCYSSSAIPPSGHMAHNIIIISIAWTHSHYIFIIIEQLTQLISSHCHLLRSSAFSHDSWSMTLILISSLYDVFADEASKIQLNERNQIRGNRTHRNNGVTMECCKQNGLNFKHKFKAKIQKT